MIRSFLFVPADSPRKLEKAYGSTADALILDLEDAIAEGQKAQARTGLATFLESVGHRAGPRLYVRINALDSGHALEDLKATMPFAIEGVVLPKCRGAADVERLSGYLEAFETVHGRGLGSCRIIAIATENAASVLGLHAYATTPPSPRLAGLMWGAEDLGADLGARHSREHGALTPPFALARSLCVMAAASARVQPIDAVSPEIDNAPALRGESLAARRDGFTAKAAIHPGQLEVINAAFAPSEQDIAWARRVIAAFAAGDGVTRLDGAMLDRPHLRHAEAILAQAGR